MYQQSLLKNVRMTTLQKAKFDIAYVGSGKRLVRIHIEQPLKMLSQLYM